MAAKPRFDGEWVRLGDLGNTQAGGTPSSKHPEFFTGTIPWIGTTALNGGLLDESNAVKMITEEAVAKSAAKIVPAGSIMVGIRVGVGKVAINAVPMCTSQDIVSITGIDTDQWNKEYISLALQYKAPILASQAQGATITGITSKTLKSITIPVLALSSQNVVVSQLRGIDRQIACAKKRLEFLGILVKSRFAEMFGDADHYEMLDQLIMDGTSISYGIVQPGSDVEGGIGVLRPVDFQAGRVEHGNIKTIDPEISGKYSRTVLTGNELLVVVRGATGDVALSDASLKGMNVTRGIAVVRYDRNKIIPEFLVGYLKSDEAQRYIAEHTQGSALKQINMADLRVQPIKVPSLDLQQEFAAFVARVEKSRFIVQQQIEKLQMLYDSLAQEYFS